MKPFDNLRESLPSLANLTMRGASIVARFGLTILLARALNLDDIGKYGLIVGFAAVVPAVLGFGLNHYVSRELIGLDAFEAGKRVRDRLTVSLLVTVIASLLAFAARCAGLPLPDPLLWLVILCAFETYALDMHLILIGAQKPFTANLVYFVRSSLWVLPLTLLFLAAPMARSLNAVLILWLGGLVAGMMVAAVSIRHWPWRRVAAIPVDRAWLRQRIGNAGLIYINDIGIALLAYADRYVISYFLGLLATGIYTVYWSFGNALFTLVSAALIQTSVPQLVLTLREHGRPAFERKLWRKLVSVAAVGLGFAVAIYIAFELLRATLLPTIIMAPVELFPLLLLGTLIRLLSDVLNIGLYSDNRDRPLALINIIGGVGSTAITAFFVHVAGISGAGYAMVFTALMLFAARLVTLRRARNA